MCALVGSDTVIGWIGTKLGIKPGETTQDKLFTLSIVGNAWRACRTGPMMQVNDDYYERLTEEKLDRILADLRQTGTSSLKTGPVHVAGTGKSGKPLGGDSLKGRLSVSRSMRKLYEIVRTFRLTNTIQTGVCRLAFC